MSDFNDWKLIRVNSRSFVIRNLSQKQTGLRSRLRLAVKQSFSSFRVFRFFRGSLIGCGSAALGLSEAGKMFQSLLGFKSRII